MVVVAHDRDNLVRGVGGPPDPAVLYDAEQTADVLAAAGCAIVRAGQVGRPVEAAHGARTAVDTLVRGMRPV